LVPIGPVVSEKKLEMGFFYIQFYDNFISLVQLGCMHVLFLIQLIHILINIFGPVVSEKKLEM
jgi:hypothetical protein